MQQLSRQSVENLLDLVEIKLSCIQVLDREDQREQENLETCHDELLEIREELARHAAAAVRARQTTRGRAWSWRTELRPLAASTRLGSGSVRFFRDSRR